MSWSEHATADLIDKGVLEIGDGYRAKNSEMAEEGVPFVRAGDVDGRVNTIGTDLLSAESVKKVGRKRSMPGDVVMTTKGTIGRLAYVQEGDPDFIYSPQLCFWRSLDESLIEPRWLFYAMRSSEMLNQISWSAGQTDMAPYVSLTDQRTAFKITLPPASEQREIAGVLGALDDKIEANRKASACLEEMARALYRSWFVTFDPVHAKSQNRPPAHMPPTTAALFPDRFGENGLPEGWEWEAFESHYTVLETGKRPKGGIKDVEDGVPSIGAESIKQVGFFDFGKTKFIPRDYFEAMKKGRLSDGDILIYKDGGKPGELRPAATYISKGFPFDEACINEHVFRVRMGDDLGQYFGFLALSSDHCMHQMRELATGVAQPGLNQSAMKALSFLKPGEPKIIESFNQMVGPLLDGCNEKAKENQTLATLRDTLLPRLMSGTLRVKVAEAEVEAVV